MGFLTAFPLDVPRFLSNAPRELLAQRFVRILLDFCCSVNLGINAVSTIKYAYFSSTDFTSPSRLLSIAKASFKSAEKALAIVLVVCQ